MKKTILGLSTILAATFAINAYAESPVKDQYTDFKEAVDELNWDCKIDDNSYFYQGLDQSSEEPRIIYKFVYDGETICESEDPQSLCNSYVVAKTPWAYKKGVITDNANGNNYYRICRTDRKTIPGAVDKKFEVGLDSNK